MVDPITVTYSVINITSCVVQAAKNISDLRDKYQNAANTITSICAESSSISASLSQIQGLLLRDASNLEAHFENRPELRETFDTALTGCTVIYACLEEEIQRLRAGARDADAMTWKVKCRFIWREDTMRDLLSQLRGQQMALNLLIQMLQLESLSELKQLMRDNNAMMSKVAQRSKSLRQTHPLIRVSSVFSKERDSVMDNSSTIGQTEFEFDDTIVNSRAYRRALAAAQNRPSTGRSVTEPPPETVPDVEKLTIEDPARQPGKELAANGEDLSDSGSGSTERIGEIVPPMAERKLSDPLPERRASEAMSSVERLDVRSEKEAMSQVSSRPVSPVIRRKPLQRKPLPANHHGLVSSPSVLTLSSISTAPPPYQESSFYSSSETASQLSRRTSAWSSVFSAGTNPINNLSRISLPETIESGSETASQISRGTSAMSSTFSTGTNPINNLSRISLPETIESDSNSDNDANTLMERVSSSGADSQTSATTFDPEPSTPEPSTPELHSIHQQLLTSETSYLNKLNILRTFIEEPLARRFPAIWRTLTALHQLPTIRACSDTHLLTPLRTHPLTPSTFTTWTQHASPAYLTYLTHHPATLSALLHHSATNPQLATFLATFTSTHSLADLLAQPLYRLAAYHRILSAHPSLSSGPLEALHTAATEAKHAADLDTLATRITAIDPVYAARLDLASPHRRLLHQSPLACRAHAKGPWRPVRAVLLDNFFLLGRWESHTGGGACRDTQQWYNKKLKSALLEEPLAVGEALQVGVSGVPGKPGRAGVRDEVPRGTELWGFFVQVGAVVHLLAAGTEGERRAWMERVRGAKEGVGE